MSCVSGKCDLCDHFFGLLRGAEEGMPLRERFELFKKRVHGQIYKYVSFKLTRFNAEIEASRNPFLTYRDTVTTVKDKRCKTGERTVTTRIYTYLGKDYTEDELHKIDYHTKVVIPIDSIEDLIPYFDYCLASMASSPEGDTIVLAETNENDDRFISSQTYGTGNGIYDRRKNLYRLGRDLILEYYGESC